MEHVQGQGPPIVFVHGNGSTHETWAAVIAHLRDRFTCISYDLPGHGGAALPPGRLDLELFVRDLVRLSDTHNLGKACFIGHSLGAFIVAAYALANPARVSALGLLAAPVARSDAEQVAGRDLVATLKRDGVAKTMQKLVGFWYTAPFLEAHPDALQERLKQVASLDEDVFIRTYELYIETEIAPWLARIAARTLLMTGEFATGASAEVARRSAAILPHAEVAILDGMKNGILTEVPHRVADAIGAFLARQRA